MQALTCFPAVRQNELGIDRWRLGLLLGAVSSSWYVSKSTIIWLPVTPTIGLTDAGGFADIDREVVF